VVRLFEIKAVSDFLLKKSQAIYKPNQELSLDEAMIPCRGRLQI
jgi:hypothetical protein